MKEKMNTRVKNMQNLKVLDQKINLIGRKLRNMKNNDLYQTITQWKGIQLNVDIFERFSS